MLGIYVAEQTIIFLQSVLLGAALGLIYDVFRISRIAFPLSSVIIAVEDILYFAICAIVTFFFLLGSIDGYVRVFLLVGELIGWILYYYTLGQLVMRLSKTIIHLIRAVLNFISRWILYPIWRLIYFIISLILKPFIFLGGIIKKILLKSKYSLKKRRVILYNHGVTLFSNWKRKILKRETNLNDT